MRRSRRLRLLPRRNPFGLSTLSVGLGAVGGWYLHSWWQNRQSAVQPAGTLLSDGHDDGTVFADPAMPGTTPGRELLSLDFDHLPGRPDTEAPEYTVPQGTYLSVNARVLNSGPAPVSSAPGREYMILGPGGRILARLGLSLAIPQGGTWTMPVRFGPSDSGNVPVYLVRRDRDGDVTLMMRTLVINRQPLGVQLESSLPASNPPSLQVSTQPFPELTGPTPPTPQGQGTMGLDSERTRAGLFVLSALAVAAGGYYLYKRRYA